MPCTGHSTLEKTRNDLLTIPGRQWLLIAETTSKYPTRTLPNLALEMTLLILFKTQMNPETKNRTSHSRFIRYGKPAELLYQASTREPQRTARRKAHSSTNCNPGRSCIIRVGQESATFRFSHTAATLGLYARCILVCTVWCESYTAIFSKDCKPLAFWIQSFHTQAN
jgi:hypothetical protein